MEISARGRTTAARRRTPQVNKTKPANGNGGDSHATAPELDLKKLLRALQAVRNGDFSVRLAPDQTGLGGKIADAFNEMVSANERMAMELERAGQMVGRVAWDGILIPPDANELGWKETVRTNPLEHTIVALRPVAPVLPFKVPNSTRLIDVTMPAGTILAGPPGGFADPAGNPVTVTNHLVNFGWEYVIHCHLLGHEEMDMMHAQAFVVAPEAPSNLNATAALLGRSVTLTWVDNSISETGFTIQRATNAGFTTGLVTFTVSPNTVTYVDTTTVPGTTYYYRVQANNVVGDTTVYPAPSIGFPQNSAQSKWSNSKTVNTSLPAFIALRAFNGQYVVAENGGGGAVNANRNTIGPWETFGLINRGNGNVALRASNGQYVVAENGGGGLVRANRNAIGPWETFGLIDRGNGNIALRANNGQYVCAEGGGGREVVANRNVIGAWETFRLIPR